MEQQDWATKELGLADLGDERLNARLIYLAEKFSESPESSVSQVFGGWADLKAAYRFFSNEKVSDKEILSSHIQATKDRCKTENEILVIQDTTYFNYTTHTKTSGLGALNNHKGLNVDKLVASGLIMHTAFAISGEGLPLGILDQKIYGRDELSAEIKELKKQTHNTAFPIEERESYRWLDSLKNSNHVLGVEKNKLITICDREADIYEFFKLAVDNTSQVIVRARHDRTVNKSSPFSRTTGERLWGLLKKEGAVGQLEVHIPKTDKEEERDASCEVRFKKVSISPTYYNMKNQSEKLPALTLNAVYVLEKDAPKDVEPIEWMLLTNLEVTNFEQALGIIKKYCLRWRIEVFHKILKSGLKVEDCRLSTAERLTRYLSLMSIVAWRIFWITLIGRSIPEFSCLIFLSDIEWKILYAKFNPNRKIPKRPSTIKQVLIWIAQLGGFLARKADKEPGITHIWRGLRKFFNLLEGSQLTHKLMGNS